MRRLLVKRTEDILGNLMAGDVTIGQSYIWSMKIWDKKFGTCVTILNFGIRFSEHE